MTEQDHTYASAIVDAQKNHKRKASEFYPTPADATVALMRYFGSTDTTEKKLVVWEPACGDGLMSRVLEDTFHSVWSTDLREATGYGHGGKDFLTIDMGGQLPPDWIITNPPFSLAEDFIKKALSITPNVAMLLKSQYWHAAKRFKLFRDHEPARVLPLTWRPSFLEKERGNSPLMDVMWVVWMDGDTSARYEPLPRPEGHAALREKYAVDAMEGLLG